MLIFASFQGGRSIEFASHNPNWLLEFALALRFFQKILIKIVFCSVMNWLKLDSILFCSIMN
jgi:hypothetical protein